jgi:hypothetical protein
MLPLIGWVITVQKLHNMLTGCVTTIHYFKIHVGVIQILYEDEMRTRMKVGDCRLGFTETTQHADRLLSECDNTLHAGELKLLSWCSA